MDRKTVAVYEQKTADWIAHRNRPIPAALPRFAARVSGTVADLGCGPGWHTATFGSGAVALDAAYAMAASVREFAPDARPLQGDLERLPFRRGALDAAWASKCYMHIPADRVPYALAELHASMKVGARLYIRVTSDRLTPKEDGLFRGRHFSYWPEARLCDVVTGAGFDVELVEDDGKEWLDIEATRARTLPDTVGPGMRVLVVGLNPSEYAADAGYGFARPGNRFWPAALASGLVTRAHDPFHAYRVDRVGMTDLVKRATPRADALTVDEYVAGAARVERLVEWLQPAAVCFAGLDGYGKVRNRKAVAGWQAEPFGGRPAYVMPNPSGLNAHTKPADFETHLRTTQLAPQTAPMGPS